MTGINAIFYIAASIPPWWLTDAVGRRPILLTGAISMAVALTATGWFIYIDQSYTPNAGECRCRITFTEPADPPSRRLGHHLQRGIWHVLGPNPVALPARDHATAFPGQGRFPIYRDGASSCVGVKADSFQNWIANYWVGVTTPLFQQLIGWRLYIMHAFFCVVSFILGEWAIVGQWDGRR